MKMTFEEYVMDWWSNLLETITENEAKRIMENEFIGEEETVDDHLPSPELEVQNCREWLSLQDDATAIYKTFFGSERSDYTYSCIPSTEKFLTDMFMHCAGWFSSANEPEPSFAEDFVPDMAYHAQGYETPLGFFMDLQHGGCSSGIIGMLISNQDCKDIYIKHIDDMEAYKEEIEGELGSSVKNRFDVPHYTFVCWLCYEELGYQIGRTLFPETF